MKKQNARRVSWKQGEGDEEEMRRHFKKVNGDPKPTK